MNQEARVARRVVVHGRVQGVFFREAARREAEQAGVTGWVRNRPDDTVEALFEGPEAAVDQLVSWTRVGPPHASVEQVEVEETAPTGEADFRVV